MSFRLVPKSHKRKRKIQKIQ